MVISTGGHGWRGRTWTYSSAGTSNAALAIEKASSAAPAHSAVEDLPAVDIEEEEEADDAASDDSGGSYTARDGRHFHWEFIRMEKQYFQVMEDIAKLQRQLDDSEAVRTAAKNRASELETRLIESEANVAGKLSFLQISSNVGHFPLYQHFTDFSLHPCSSSDCTVG